MQAYPLCPSTVLTHRIALRRIALQAQCSCKVASSASRNPHKSIKSVLTSDADPRWPFVRPSSSSCAVGTRMNSGLAAPPLQVGSLISLHGRPVRSRRSQRKDAEDVEQREGKAMMEQLWQDTVGDSSDVKWEAALARMQEALASASSESLSIAVDQELQRSLPSDVPRRSIESYMLSESSTKLSASAKQYVRTMRKRALLIEAAMFALISRHLKSQSADTYLRAAVRLAAIGRRTLLIEPHLHSTQLRSRTERLRKRCASSMRRYVNIARPLLTSVGGNSQRDGGKSEIRWIRIESLEVEAFVLEGRMAEAQVLLSNMLHMHADLLVRWSEYARRPGDTMLPIQHHLSALNDAVTAVLQYECTAAQRPLAVPMDSVSNFDVMEQSYESASEDIRARNIFRWLFQHSFALSFITAPVWRSAQPFCELASHVRQPEHFVTELLSEVGRTHADAGEPLGAFLRGLSFNGRQGAAEAGRLWLVAHNETDTFPEEDTVAIIKSLDDQHMRSLATTIATCFLQSQKDLHQLQRRSHTILANHFSRIGDTERMQIHLENLSNIDPHGASTVKHRHMCLRQAAEFTGDLEMCRRLCEQMLEEGLPPEDVERYTLKRLARIHLRRGELDEADEIRENLLARGDIPSASFFEQFVIAACNNADAERASLAVNDLHQIGATLSEGGYAAIIRLYAARQEPEHAREAFQDMIRAGIDPSPRTMSRLANAYVEAGSWDALMSLYRWASGQPHRHLRPDIHLCSLVLKAMVLTRTPVQDILTVYMQMRRAGIVPNSYMYLHLLQSACDASMMPVAESIFNVIDERLGGQARQRRKSPVVLIARRGEGADTAHFSVMIHAYLRLNRSSDALEYFKEMRRRELEPSSLTYAAIIQAYVNSGVEENIVVAEELALKVISGANLGKDFEDDPLGVLTQAPASLSGNEPLAHHAEALLSPIMHARALSGKTDVVLTIFRKMKALGGRVSLRTFSSLLLAYRASADIDGAMDVWKALYSEALREAKAGVGLLSGQSDAQASIPASKRNFICNPLSIIIDSLSVAGRHDEVAKIWTQVRADGFGFDSHNFNILAQATLRAGRIEDCLRLIEGVLNNPTPASLKILRDEDRESVTHTAMDGGVEDQAITEGGIDLGQNLFPPAVEVKMPGASGSAEALRDDHTLNAEFVRSPARPPTRRYEQRHRKDRSELLPIEAMDMSEERFLSQDSSTLEQVDKDLNAALDQDQADPDEVARLRLKRSQLGAERTSEEPRPSSHPDLLHKFETNREREISSWFAHHETLCMLEEALVRLQQGQSIAREDMYQSSAVSDAVAFSERRQLYNRLRSEYPRARQIVDSHRLQVDARAEATERMQQPGVGRMHVKDHHGR